MNPTTRSGRVILVLGVLFVLVAGVLSAQTTSQPLSPGPPVERSAGQGVPFPRGFSLHHSSASKEGSPLAPKDWGLANQSYIEVPATQFHILDSAGGWTTTGFGYSSPVGLYQTSGFLQNFATGITSVLPAGAQITYLELDYCDTNVITQNTHGWLAICVYDGSGCNIYGLMASANGDGCTLKSTDLTPLNLFVNKFDNSYTLLANTEAQDGTNIINGVILGYKLQVSNYAGTPDFLDVPASNPQYQFIEALYHSGITVGCGGGNYCPNNPLTRGQMAVYLAKALGLYFQN